MNKITVKKACELAKISRPTFYKYVNNGTLSVIKDNNHTFVEISELVRVFPDKLNNVTSNYQKNDNISPNLTTELTHKDELIEILKQQLKDKQQNNDFLQNQLTEMNKQITYLNNILENKNKPNRKKFLGIF
jgi:peptidoglycan hydrolase CwlO-like protein